MTSSGRMAALAVAVSALLAGCVVRGGGYGQVYYGPPPVAFMFSDGVRAYYDVDYSAYVYGDNGFYYRWAPGGWLYTRYYGGPWNPVGVQVPMPRLLLAGPPPPEVPYRPYFLWWRAHAARWYAVHHPYWWDRHRLLVRHYRQWRRHIRFVRARGFGPRPPRPVMRRFQGPVPPAPGFGPQGGPPVPPGGFRGPRGPGARLQPVRPVMRRFQRPAPPAPGFRPPGAPMPPGGFRGPRGPLRKAHRRFRPGRAFRPGRFRGPPGPGRRRGPP